MASHDSSAPIAVLDSGVGGLSVLASIRARLPNEDVLYFADSGRAPWGGRSPETIRRFVMQIASFLDLFEPKHLVLACNTAAAVATSELRRAFSHLGITGVIEPGARAAVAAVSSAYSPTIGLLATEATVRSRVFEHAIAARSMKTRMHAAAAPLLAAIVEEGRDLDDPLVELALKQYIEPLLMKRPHAILLGCTHYHVLRPTIERLFPGVLIVDSAEATADNLLRRLTSTQMLRQGTATSSATKSGTSSATSSKAGTTNAAMGRCQFFTTGDPIQFSRVARRMTGLTLAATPVSIDELESPPARESLVNEFNDIRDINEINDTENIDSIIAA